MEIKDLIIDNRREGIFRVNRAGMTSQELFEIEQERVFNKSWLYLGHESEVDNPGDYRRRFVAGKPVFFAKGSDGRIRAFLNTCPHRGAMICRRDEGNTEVFQCFYHAWSFSNQGDLIGVPGEEAYSDYFNRKELGLKSPPRVESYRGFYFISFNPYIEDLVSYLAGAREYLDLVADQTDIGMRIVTGSNRYSIKANWKLLCENSLDGYHGRPVHQTYFDYISSLEDNPAALDAMFDQRWRRSRALGNGHAVIDSSTRGGRPIANWHPLFGEDAKEEIAGVRAKLVDKYGEDWAYRMANTSRNLLIYPNLVINDIMAITIRIFWPTAPDHMEVTAWNLAPKEETGNALARRLDSFLTFLGPGGFATPDDVEALESCQIGFRCGDVEWSDISRGMHSQDPITTDELQMRTFWRQWHAHMMGQERASNPYDVVEDALAPVPSGDGG
jgi:p-cumate 2,3-dioxygenase alpha subunit